MGIREYKYTQNITPKNSEVLSGKVDKNILRQLCSLKKEREDLRRRIAGQRKELGEKERNEKLTYRELYLNELMEIEEEIDRNIYLAEQFIESIDNSRIRRIMRYKCLDDSLSWIQIAHKMGENFTAESCRQLYERAIGSRK